MGQSGAIDRSALGFSIDHVLRCGIDRDPLPLAQIWCSVGTVADSDAGYHQGAEFPTPQTTGIQTGQVRPAQTSHRRPMAKDHRDRLGLTSWHIEPAK